MKLNYTAQIKTKESMGLLDTAQQVVAFVKQIQREIASIREIQEEETAPVRAPFSTHSQEDTLPLSLLEEDPDRPIPSLSDGSTDDCIIQFE
ncbi:hypothetical protein COB11_07285 [Candidatus Aerophobetes bacterium]|uniref:Uncharacterized protein n=1 Tax=Aerophobetes bacterium TaxID=2030807 RepID=A0A2A4YCZ1_UNCAE|nr:MAG: hypothetical protein COB11_07285 [Candidatus Aerophobetes bacterium]